MEIKFTILGKPMGKQRPKFSRVGGFIKTYTPKETANYETLVKLSYQQKYNDFNFDKDIPLEVDIKVYAQIPKGLSKKKQLEYEQETIPYTKKPDWDNIGKIVCDSLNGIAYYDDNQIVKGIVTKYYGKTARVEVCIKEYERS